MKHILGEFMHEYNHITAQTFQGQYIGVIIFFFVFVIGVTECTMHTALFLQGSEIMNMNIIRFIPYVYTVIVIQVG